MKKTLATLALLLAAASACTDPLPTDPIDIVLTHAVSGDRMDGAVSRDAANDVCPRVSQEPSAHRS